MKLKFFLFILIVTVSTTVVFSQKKQSTIDPKKLDTYFAQMAADWDIPSMSIGIVKDGKLVFAKSYGHLEIGKSEKPDANTLYAIASNSKAFTSAIIGMLVQEGKLSWDDKVKDYLPYFEVYDPWVSKEITIRDLLSHRVGLGTFSGDVIWYKSNLSASAIVKGTKYLSKSFDFRAGYGYSNVMYIAAGEVIKKVTGKPWSEVVQERILIPLDMNRTITNPNQLEEKGNFATPHGRKESANFPIEWENWEEIGAMGGLISSVNDVSKWMIFNLNKGIHGKDTLLTAKTINNIWTPHNNFRVDQTKKNDFNRHFSAYGLGWSLSDYHGNLRMGHTGGYDGMITAVTMVPDQNLGVVVLTNGMKSPITAATNYALDTYLGIKVKDWSKELLKLNDSNEAKDTRVADRIKKRVLNTQPSLPIEKYVGTFKSAIYGKIIISNEQNTLRLNFEHSPNLSASLSHWHYDVWKIEWDTPHAWLDFGMVKFNFDNNLEILGIDFDVPNDDIFFEELKPVKIE
ncbi:MAG: serine hydrolase [Flavobacteriaceae bacterium]|nr:serine hydrolase [Flavobacteriaceae bacterium]